MCDKQNRKFKWSINETDFETVSGQEVSLSKIVIKSYQKIIKKKCLRTTDLMSQKQKMVKIGTSLSI